jgi:hypothetical protein
MESVRQRLECWRRNRKQRSAIPEELWASAVELADEYGLAKTARVLRLNYYDLQGRLQEKSQPMTSHAKSAFMELIPQAAAAVSECTVEIEEPSGARMRVHLKGTAVPDVISLSDTFWRAHR